MDPDILAPFFVVITLILAVSGVILLRPLSKRLGDVLEAIVDEKRNQGSVEIQVGQVRDLIENLDSRMRLLEERQDFADSLLASKQQEGKLLSDRGQGGPISQREVGEGDP